MPSELHYQVKRLVTAFRNNSAYVDALRIQKSVLEYSGSANWDKIFQTSQTRAQDLFRSALSDLDNDVPIAPVLGQLLTSLGEP
jgi:hypothetical protein